MWDLCSSNWCADLANDKYKRGSAQSRILGATAETKCSNQCSSLLWNNATDQNLSAWRNPLQLHHQVHILINSRRRPREALHFKQVQRDAPLWLWGQPHLKLDPWNNRATITSTFGRSALPIIGCQLWQKSPTESKLIEDINSVKTKVMCWLKAKQSLV